MAIVDLNKPPMPEWARRALIALDTAATSLARRNLAMEAAALDRCAAWIRIGASQSTTPSAECGNG